MHDSETILTTLAGVPLGEWRTVLAGFCTSGGLKTSLEHLLRDEKQLEQVTRSSFFHPTGGYKLVLASLGYDGCEMRLHIWPTGTKVERDHNLYTAHNHKWSFASYVLHGAFIERIFRESSDPGAEPDYDRYRYDSPVRGKEYDSRLVGPCRLDELFCVPIVAGAAYSQSSELIHTFVPADAGLAATLFARMPYLPVTHTDVYVPKGQRPVLDRPSGGPPRIDRREVVELIELILSA